MASATRLQFPEQSDPADRIEAFGKSLVVLVDAKDPANSLLLKKPTARIPHAGGQRIQPGSPEEAALRTWIDRLAQLKGDDLAKAMHYREEEASGAGAVRPRIMLRRLTHSQYNNTVRDLLGDRSLPANQFPPEDFVNGFKNQYVAQNLSPLLEDAYSAAAEKLARAAFRNGNSHDLVDLPALGGMPRQISSRPSACRPSAVRSTAVERGRYEALFQKQTGFRHRRATRRGSDAAIAQLPLPSGRHHQSQMAALRRGEPSVVRALGFHARRRAAGRCRTRRTGHSRGVAHAARRMLDDPKARQALDEFAAQWLRFDRVLTATKERRAFPQFTPDTALAMTQEARRFVSDLVWDESRFHRDLHRRRTDIPMATWRASTVSSRRPTTSTASRFPPTPSARDSSARRSSLP